jgi:hypothetical protein
MKIREEIEINLRKGAENLLSFLDTNYYLKYDSIVENFISEMIKNENKDFMTIYNDYDRTSFVQYDIILMLFSSYCKNVLGSEILIKYINRNFADAAGDEQNIKLLLTFKNVSVEYINNLIEHDPRVMKEHYYNELFSYHMGYNDAYDIATAIRDIIDLSLNEEEKTEFEAYKKRNEEESKKRKRNEEEDYYLKRRERKMKKKAD